MPGEHADRARDRRITRQQADEEHAWARPSAWFGGEGRHRGVGPKGYVRSDERIRELVCDDLMDDPWLDASHIEVAVKDGEVTLSGTVEDRDAKRWAEDVAEHTGGVKHVQNNLRVETAH
jgi:osmotically-inducible protein OsmY